MFLKVLLSIQKTVFYSCFAKRSRHPKLGLHWDKFESIFAYSLNYLLSIYLSLIFAFFNHFFLYPSSIRVQNDFIEKKNSRNFFSLQKIEMKSEMLEMKGVRKFKVDTKAYTQVDIKVETLLYMNVDKRLNHLYKKDQNK